jgi:hypothetical protein
MLLGFFGVAYLIISLVVSADFIPWKKLFPVRVRINGKVSLIEAARTLWASLKGLSKKCWDSFRVRKALWLRYLAVVYASLLSAYFILPDVLREGASMFQQFAHVSLDSGYDALILIIALLIAALATASAGGVIAAIEVHNLLRDLGWGENRSELWNVVVKFAGRTLAFGFVIGCLLAFLKTPPLPVVQIGGEADYKGSLLAHAQGYWYVFEREGELIVIPDEDVKTVRIRSQGE